MRRNIFDNFEDFLNEDKMLVKRKLKNGKIILYWREVKKKSVEKAPDLKAPDLKPPKKTTVKESKIT